MLLTRSLPPQFLLPAWGTRNLYQVFLRAYGTDEAFRSRSNRRVKKGRRLAKPPLSLYEELFPEERKKASKAPESIDTLPPFQWDEGLGNSSGLGERPKEEERDQRESHSTARHQNETLSFKDQEVIPHDHLWAKHKASTSVLILNCASKTLEESDFFRVSPRGEHIEGWTRSIIKVIQSRDTNTLEPLGTYFIIFSSDEAARAYLDQTIHLHRLARVNSGSLQSATLPPPPGYLRPGEDVKTALRTFSLVPGHGKLSISLATRPFKPSILQMLNEGGTAGIARLQTKGEGMVRFSVDIGQISYSELKTAIRDDGKRRNLLWDLNEDWFSSLARNQQDDVTEDLLGDSTSDTDQLATKRAYRAPARYVLSFRDRYEARRFVREWHRRPFPTKKEVGLGDELPPIVNAEIMW